MIQKITGCVGMIPLECVSPRKDKWKIRWSFKELENGMAEWMEQDFDHKPTMEEVKNSIIKWYNSQIDVQIISGFKWKNMSVWLSTENQFNYKAAFDAAVMSDGQTLPVTFKFGTDDEPLYYEFTDIEELSDFYYKSVTYVQKVLKEGWETKDNINFSVYV